MDYLHSPFELSQPPDNIHWREERAPLGALCYLLNIIGIVGNTVVLYIFLTRMPASNYRVFVMSLSGLDLSMCIDHVIKELNRMFIIYRQFEDVLQTHLCAIGNYIGYLAGVPALPIVTFIAFERYRKICTPFKPQITIKRSKIMCIVSILLSIPIVSPVYEIYGVRFVKVDNITATRCDIKNKYDYSVLPFVFPLFTFISVSFNIVAILIFQIKIRNALVQKAKSKMRMKNLKNTTTLKVVAGTANQEEAKKPQPSVEDQEAAKNRRIAITFSIVTSMLVISFVTLNIFHLAQGIERYVSPNREISKVEDVVNEYVPDAIILNGILNPFVYFFTDNQFRQEVFKLCGRNI